MGQRIKRNLMAVAIGIFLYIIYFVIVVYFERSIWELIGTYVVILSAAYFLNRKTIWALRGNYAYVVGRTEVARKYLQKAVNSGTKSPSAYIYLALLLVKYDNNATDAFKHLEQAIKIARDKTEERTAIITQATCHYMNGDTDAAIKVLEEMRKNHDYVNANANITLGYLYLRANRLDEAKHVTDLAIEEEPTSAAAWDNLGQILYAKNEIDEARKAFEAALERKSSMADSNYYMGLICEVADEKAQAKEYFRQASISPFTSFNTITQEQADEKYNEYHN